MHEGEVPYQEGFEGADVIGGARTVILAFELLCALEGEIQQLGDRLQGVCAVDRIPVCFQQRVETACEMVLIELGDVLQRSG